MERSGDGRPRERLLLVLGTAVWMGVVLATVFPLATRRHFQVDELQNAYNASLLWRWDDAAAAATVHPEPFQALLGAATRGMTRTTDVLLTFRCVFVLFFVANLVLLGWALPSLARWWERLLALAVGATLLPLWEYGFEIRHDVLLLTVTLASFVVLQRAAASERLSRPTAAGVGALAALVLATAQKAAPFALLAGALGLWLAADRYPGRTRRHGMAGAAGWMGAGFAAAASLLGIALAATGRLGLVVKGVFAFAAHLEGLGEVARLSPVPVLRLFLEPQPLLGALAVVQVALAARAFARAPRRCEGGAVTAAFLVASLALLFVNPRPFPYNLLLVAPFFCLAALDGAGRLRRGARGAVLGLLLVANLAGLALVVRQRPYLRYPSSFQLGFAEAAEEMTGPGEPVLDGIGLVVTRPPADRDWLIHSSFQRAYDAGRRTRVSEIVRREAPPVVLMSYRLTSLAPAELLTLRERYVEVQPDFLVLGGVVTPHDPVIVVRRAGRYEVELPAGATFGDGRGSGVHRLEEGSYPVAHLASPGRYRWVGSADAVEKPPPPVPPKPRSVPLMLPFSWVR